MSLETKKDVLEDTLKRQGKEIVNALKRKFPFTKKALDYVVLHGFIFLAGAYSKKEFLNAFKENYMDLIEKVGPALREETPVIVAALHRTLYNQKDLFFCMPYKIGKPPCFPREAVVLLKGREPEIFIVNNGYEYLALSLLEKLPHEVAKVYFDRYKDEPNKLFDLQLLSLYYNSVKNLEQLISFSRKVNTFFLDSFLFFIEKAYGVKIEEGEIYNLSRAGKIIEFIATKFHTEAEEIIKTIATKPIDFFIQRGEEIFNTLKKEFPFMEEKLNFHKNPHITLFLGAYSNSKEEFLKAFRENYIDLVKRIAHGLKDDIYVILASIHRTLSNQKDLFECGFLFTPPRFPRPTGLHDLDSHGFIINNGYENLAFTFLVVLHPKAFDVYFERYKDNPSKFFDLYLASSYYKHVKRLENYDEKVLNNLLDAIEKVTKQEHKKILEAWL